MVKCLLQQTSSRFHNKTANCALTSKKQAFCTETSTYQAVNTTPFSMPKPSVFGILKVLIINTRFPAKTLPLIQTKKKTPFALIRKVGNFAGLGSQVHRTCSQDFTTSEHGIMTRPCQAFSSASTR